MINDTSFISVSIYIANSKNPVLGMVHLYNKKESTRIKSTNLIREFVCYYDRSLPHIYSIG